jgi:hypothetical protein
VSVDHPRHGHGYGHSDGPPSLHDLHRHAGLGKPGCAPALARFARGVVGSARSLSDWLEILFGFTRRRQMAALALVLLVVAGFLGRSVWLEWPHVSSGTISNATWTRILWVEQLRPARESSWRTYPANARDVTSEESTHTESVDTGQTRTVTSRVQTGSHSVVVGQRDLGNGFFEDVTKDVSDYGESSRDEKIYESRTVTETLYHYTIDRWVRARSANLSGTKDPSWPEPKLAENERVGEREEIYTYCVRVPDHADFLVTDHDAAMFSKCTVGTRVRVRWTLSGMSELAGVAQVRSTATSATTR